MQYILNKEEIENLVPKHELIDVKEQLKAVVAAFRTTNFCVQHQHGEPCEGFDYFGKGCPGHLVSVTENEPKTINEAAS